MDRVSADRGVGSSPFFMPSTQVDPPNNTILICIGLGLVGALLHSEWASGPKNQLFGHFTGGTIIVIRTNATDIFDLASQPIPLAFAESSLPDGLERI